ncbi:hypothetical protein [Lyngbya sp. PCC 8106]|uniref:DUF7219 family protein n=1 Tax=Lyngbya sp. (strain PCC 8106) TaxID=313612 RepID=UPI0000EA94F9|nr:hypothetical protein [Lyngbya sp. PCC 8106]EAW33527.1 hypothetical protein L8106_27651 [Lyngbya sp. PCC 8106]
MNERDKFIYPKSRYRGEFSPEHLVFNANIQEFAHKVNYICGLETNGKITPDEAYHRIKALWKQLKSSKKNLQIGEGGSDHNSESPNP